MKYDKEQFIKKLYDYGFGDLVKYDKKGNATYYDITHGVNKALRR